MAFKDIDQMLINECVKDVADLEKIKELIAQGADINAFDEEYEQTLYEEILDFYIDRKTKKLNLSNLSIVTELFVEKGLILNPKPDDCDYFFPYRFKLTPPEKVCVDIFKMLLGKGTVTFAELDSIINDNALDLHMDMFYFYEQTRYKKNDSLNYFLELIYWSCAYQVKLYPENCSEDLLSFDWFDREKNKVELIRENRSTGVFIEDLETHERAEIQGWTRKY